MHEYFKLIENWLFRNSEIRISKGHVRLVMIKNDILIWVLQHWTQFLIFHWKSNPMCSTFCHQQKKIDVLYLCDPIENWIFANRILLLNHSPRICILRFTTHRKHFTNLCDWIYWKVGNVGQVLILTWLRNALWLSVYSPLHIYMFVCRNTFAHWMLTRRFDGTRERKWCQTKRLENCIEFQFALPSLQCEKQQRTRERVRARQPENAVSVCIWATNIEFHIHFTH